MAGQPPANSLLDRYTEIKERIRQAAEKSGRPESSICLLGVTKTVAAERILEAAKLGIRDFGENKVQEALSKKQALEAARFEPPIRHHFIGSLQTNKARKAVEWFDVIQTIDRPKTAEAVDRMAAELGKKQRCLIEVKVSPEPTKSGVELRDAADFAASCGQFKNLSVEGFMMIGALNAAADETRAAFRSLAGVFRKQAAAFGPHPILSMGMSDDFEIAIEEGSTMVRIGRALFGARA